MPSPCRLIPGNEATTIKADDIALNPSRQNVKMKLAKKYGKGSWGSPAEKELKAF